MRELFKSLREYKGKALLTPLVMAAEAILEIIIPFIMTLLLEVIEEAARANVPLTGADFGRIAMFGAIMLALAAASMTCGVLGGKFAAEASAGFAANLRGDMYDKIQTYSFTNIDRFSTSSLITRLTLDVTTVQQSFQMIIRMLSRAPVLFVFASVMAFVIAPSIAWIFIVSACVLGVALVFIMRRVQPNFKKMFKKYDNLNAVTQENLIGIRVVKAYVLEGQEIDKYHEATEATYRYSVKAEHVLAAINPVTRFVLYATMLTILAVGGVNIVTGGGMSIPDLTGLMSYSSQIMMGIMNITMVLNFVAMSRPAMERIGEVMKEECTVTNPESPIYEVEDGSIEFRNVRFSYTGGEGTDVVQGVSLSIRSGETVGIVGGTGSSKSTLVALIPRLYDVREGSVMVGGKDVRGYDLQALRNAVSVVLQKNVLFSGSVADNLRWGDENATQAEIEHAARQACAEEFIKELPEQYEYDLGQGGVNVSGGQKQRLCIARALLKKPKVLILDDSTSAVDTRTDASIRAALKEHAKGVTKLIIAQRIASVKDADRILVLHDGRIVAFDTHDELLNSCEMYREIYQSQTQGGDEDGTV